MKKRNRNGEIWQFETEGIESESKVVLGLDGGATSTVCACAFHSLTQWNLLLLLSLYYLEPLQGAPSNHNSVGEDAARETLEQVMADALSKCGSNRTAVTAVCFAVSGVVLTIPSINTEFYVGLGIYSPAMCDYMFRMMLLQL
nr:hypothetical protein CFP56_49936 [Quercus suber]